MQMESKEQKTNGRQRKKAFCILKYNLVIVESCFELHDYDWVSHLHQDNI